MFMPIDAVSVLYAQLTRDLMAIAKFLLSWKWYKIVPQLPCSASRNSYTINGAIYNDLDWALDFTASSEVTTYGGIEICILLLFNVKIENDIR